jgi:DNA/RNA endonuclease YhcR with UshA esterase domain
MLPLQHGQALSRASQPQALSAPAGAHLSYFGGRIVSNIQVVQVIWGAGSYIPEVTSTASPSMATFYQGVLNSPYVDWLTEYNTTGLGPPTSSQTLGRGSFSQQVTITPSAANNGATIDDSNIKAELSAQIMAGTLPAPTHDAAGNNNTYYAIFFPHGKVITQGGSSSCSVFCAYHGTIANAGGAGEVYYGVHPDFQAGSGCESGCGSASTVFGNYTHVASHELVETMTDAEVGLATTFSQPLAWYDQNTNAEIGDLCVGQNGQVVGSDGVTYDVQREFSNSANDCVVTLGPPAVSSVAVSPPSIEGGTSATGTVLLTRAAPAGGATVTLASSAPGLVTVPASVAIAAGVGSATFTVTSMPTTTQTAVTITATYPAGTSATGTVNVLVAPTPVSLSLSPTSVQGGTASTGTVTLSGPAPTGGAVVTLGSTNTAAATVAASLTIAAGATSGTFPITTSIQSATTTASISAAYHGLSQTATLTVTLSPALTQISVSPSTLEGGGSATGTASLNTTAPTGGTVVSLASSSGAATVPASVTVPAGQSSAAFTITTTPVSVQTAVTISGTFPAGVTQTTSMTVLVSPTPASVTFSPNPVTGGQTTTTTVTLSGAAPSGGSVVTLSSSAPANAPVPASLTIPAGSPSGTFAIATVGQSVTTTATISASLNGLTQTGLLTISRVLPVGNATFDATLEAPRCSSVDSFCDTGGLIDGRGPVGPESNFPNTLGAACPDGTGGTYHSDESLDRLKVSTVDGTPLAAGKTVTIEATVWVWGATSDFLDLYFAPDASAPVWTPIATGLVGTTSQTLQVLSTTFVLPSATLPVIRGGWRFGGSAISCTSGTFDDHDDLVFALAAGGPPVNTPPVVNAGPDQTITLPAAASLSGTATDDGLPNPPGALTTNWSAVSGPGTVTFGNAGAKATTATFSTAGSYVLRLTANDGALSASDDVAVTVNATSSGCVTASPTNGWQNTPFTSQTSTFTAVFDATPSASPTNSAVAFSRGAQTAYTGFATLVRFNPAGDIDARNAGAFTAAAVIPYAAGKTYHFRVVVNVTAHQYSIFVTPPGGTELTVGSNFAFRSEQATVSSLDTVGVHVDASGAGTTTACNFSVSGAAPPPPDFTLTATPASRSVATGSATSYTATVAPSNGFTDAVGLSVAGLPAGVTATFSPTSITGGSGTSTMNVSVGASTVAGSTTLTIKGTDGALQHSATVTLVVTATPPPDFALTATPASQTVAPGSATSFTASVAPSNGFTDAVALSVTGLPAGATATFSPTSITGGSGTSTMNVSVGSSTPAGSSTLTIKGTDGALQHSVTVTLVVSASSGGCVTASVSTGFKNTPFATQTGTFTAQFDASPSVAPTDSTVSFSKGAQTGYAGFATLVRFNPAGKIDARNGGGFAATSSISYAAGKTYHFRVVVNVPAHTYSIFVTPPGGTEQTVGSGFAFRTEQNTVTSLNSSAITVNSGSGATTVCNFAIQ